VTATRGRERELTADDRRLAAHYADGARHPWDCSGLVDARTHLACQSDARGVHVTVRHYLTDDPDDPRADVHAGHLTWAALREPPPAGPAQGALFDLETT